MWYIPFRHNPLFTGRKEILERLRHALTANAQAGSTMLVLSGMGGIGKTQTALEYAYLYKNDYHTILWAKADSPEILNTDFASFAGLLNLPGEREQDQKYAVDAVKRWLEVHTNWLLILDNVEDLDMINDYLPPAPQGHILVTSYRSVTGGMAFRLEIDKMMPEEGVLFLLNRIGLLAPGASVDKASETDRQIASKIVDEMDGLPLAIDQAGAYIEKTACGLSGFLELYKERRGELLRRRGGLTSGHPEPITTTLALSFAKIEQAHPAVAELLRFFAFLHPDAILDELIRKGASQLGLLLHSEAAEILSLNEMIGELNNYSLVRRSSEASLSIHRLVQAVLRDNLNKESQSDWAERTVRAVNQAFPGVEFITWQQCRRYLPHAQVSAGLIEQEHMVFPEAARLLNEVGFYLYEQGQYQEAEPLLTQAVAIREQTLGPEHPDVATSLNHLAELYREQAKYGQAEPLYLRALTIQENHLELALHDLATILNNIGLLYNSQAKYAQSKQFWQRALDIRMNILGPQHPDTATSLNNLAGLYKDEGQYARARPLYERALAISEKVLGPEHPNTAATLNNLAVFYSTQRHYREAEPLFQRALAICEKALDPQHPTTIKVLEAYIAMLHQAKRNTRAKELKKRLKTTKEGQTLQASASKLSSE